MSMDIVRICIVVASSSVWGRKMTLMALCFTWYVGLLAKGSPATGLRYVEKASPGGRRGAERLYCSYHTMLYPSV